MYDALYTRQSVEKVDSISIESQLEYCKYETRGNPYSLYANPDNSRGDIINYFNENGIKQLRGGMWNTARISDMLRNPVYVRADADIYDFFKSQGADVINPVSDFTGYNACYLYKGTVSTTHKQCHLTDKEIVLAPHEGIVSSRDRIKCRVRCLSKSKQEEHRISPKVNQHKIRMAEIDKEIDDLLSKVVGANAIL